MGRYLFIVARDQPDLWVHLSREFSGEQGAEIRTLNFALVPTD